MPKTVVFGTQLVTLLFNGTALPWNANTNLYISLHTDTPTVAGDQTTNEVDYEGYERVAVTRNSGGFTVNANSISNTAEIEFPQCEAEPAVEVTYFGIGTAATGAGTLLYFAEITDGPVEIDISLIPRIPVSSLEVLEE